MNLRDLERRRDQILRERGGTVHFSPDVYVFKTQIEALNKLVEIFSEKVKRHTNDSNAKPFFNKIYGFEKQKKELAQFIQTQNYLDSQTVKSSYSGKIICLVGPPGIGKTAFAQALAKMLGKEFYSISLTGKSDSEYLLGTMPTFKAAKHGQMVEAILSTKSANPVILFDEVDKSMNRGKGRRG